MEVVEDSNKSRPFSKSQLLEHSGFTPSLSHRHQLFLYVCVSYLSLLVFIFELFFILDRTS